jgi:cyanophycin synthetase
VVTNISEDHLGLEGINSIEELAQVKEVVVQSVFKEGYAVLNADDDVVYKMKHNLDCHIALFSFTEHNERIFDHIREGGLACFADEGFLAVSRNGIKTRLARFSDIPLTAGGNAEFNSKNVLAATAAAMAQGIDVSRITKALLSFKPTPENTPGRMNIFDFGDFQVMVDYAHNPGGFAELEVFLKNIESPSKVGIIAAPGDRRDEDIRTLGKFAGRMFDEVIIRHDSDGRGRTNEELTRLLSEGVWLSDPDKKVTVISLESEALRYTIDTAKKDSFIVVFTDNVRACLEFVEHERKNYQQKFSDKVIKQH